jgi:hypothetical protein
MKIQDTSSKLKLILNIIQVSNGETKQEKQKRSFCQYLTFVHPLRKLQKLNEFAGKFDVGEKRRS